MPLVFDMTAHRGKFVAYFRAWNTGANAEHHRPTLKFLICKNRNRPTAEIFFQGKIFPESRKRISID
jgi:hypothetical protein